MAVDRCQCEHGSHFEGGTSHEYQDAGGVGGTAKYVGPVCVFCADHHVRQWLITEPAPTPQPAATVVQDTAYGYASAYGYCAQSIDFAVAACNSAIGEAKGPGNEWFITRLVAIREGLARGNRNATDALKRYDARIDRLYNLGSSD